MSRLLCLLGNENNQLQLRHTNEVYSKSNGVRPEQPWRHFNLWIRYQGEQKSWSWAWCFWKTEDLLPYEANAQERPTGKTGMSPTISHNGAPMQNTGSGLVTWDGDITTSYCTMRSLTSGRPREGNEFRMRIIWNFTAGSEGGTQLPSNQRPEVCTSEKRTQTIAWRAPGKNQTIIHDIIVFNKKKTAIKATTWRPRRTWIGCKPENRSGGSTDREICRHLRQARGLPCKQLRHRR